MKEKKRDGCVSISYIEHFLIGSHVPGKFELIHHSSGGQAIYMHICT